MGTELQGFPMGQGRLAKKYQDHYTTQYNILVAKLLAAGIDTSLLENVVDATRDAERYSFNQAIADSVHEALGEDHEVLSIKSKVQDKFKSRQK